MRTATKGRAGTASSIFRVLVVAGALLLPVGVLFVPTSAPAKRAPCAGGRFLMSGAAMSMAAGPVIAPQALTVTDTLVSISTANGTCGSRRVRLRRRKKHTIVRATLRECDQGRTSSAKVRLKAKIDNATCDTMSGVLRRGKGSRKERFTAVRTMVPDIQDVAAPSQHYVEVTFTEPTGGGLARADRYEITGPDGSALPVHDASGMASPTGGEGNRVLLTTGSQEPVTYTLRVMEGSTVAAAAAVTGSTSTEPGLLSAVATSGSTVLLTFDEPMDAATATDELFYEISAVDGAARQLVVRTAVLEPGGEQVTLTTSLQEEGVEYQVRVTNVTSAQHGAFIDPQRRTTTFFGFVPDDTTGPRVIGAESTDNTTVVVSFDEALRADAADPEHFTIVPDLTIVAATLSAARTRVQLTTLPQVAGEMYTVVADADVRDAAGNPLDSSGNGDRATFVGVRAPDVVDGTVLPRVVGAASTGNTRVIVQFSKPMSDSALVASNYVIVQENVNPEAGALAVVDADFLLENNRATVQLTTLSQNELTYRLTAVNVTDLAGNPIAPATIVGGQRIEPASATFPGTPPSAGVCSGTADPCTSDADCGTDGVCAGAPTLVDSDGDGLTDDVEQRGRVVRVKALDGTVEEIEVTSDPRRANTDGDGLGDAVEYAIGTNPRRGDTDGDGLEDGREFNFLFSDPNSVDTDGDAIDDASEVGFYKTNLLLEDSDGDGFTDGEELFEMNRNPRIADLPLQEVLVDSVSLRLDERFTFEDESGETVSEESTTASALEATSESASSHSDATTTTNLFGIVVSGGLSDECCGGSDFDPPFPLPFIRGEVSYNFTREKMVGSTAESRRATMNAFERSLGKGRELSTSSGVVREVVGAGLDASVSIRNVGDVAFAVTNLELSVLATDPENRDRLVPVATLLPGSALLSGDSPVFNLGPLDPARGPIVFSNREIFPQLVEDLMRDPRGLQFAVANFDLVDEFGRNFAFASQTARDRTAGILVDFGDGTIERFPVITSAAVGGRCDDASDNPGTICAADSDCCALGVGCNCEPFVSGRCDDAADNAGVVCAVAEDCPGGSCEEFVAGGPPTVGGFDDLGNPLGIPLDFAFQDILGLPKNPEDEDAILAGSNGKAESIAEGDDVQLVFEGIDGLPGDTIVVAAGENGILDTDVGGDDQPAVTRGYETMATCDAETDAVILAGENGRADTLADAADCQATEQGTDGLPAKQVVVTSDPSCSGEPDHFIDSTPAVDDVFVGPGTPCAENSECPGDGTCTGREALVRFEHRRRGDFGRFWAFILPDDRQFGLDFGAIRLRPGETLAMAFVQDLDRDQVIARKEAMFGSSDTLQDSDGDMLDDFAEIEIGWEVGTLDGAPIRRVFPDPTSTDSDRDGLDDRAEQDLRRVRCECAGGSDGGTSCTETDQCGGGGSCVDVLPQPEMCAYDPSTGFADCPPCPSAAIRTDPRQRDTEVDGIDDFDEALGFLSGQGIVEPTGEEIIAWDARADTLACPLDVCLGGANNGEPCRRTSNCAPTTCLNGICDGGPNDGAACLNDGTCGTAFCRQVGRCGDGSSCGEDGFCDNGRPCDLARTCSGGLDQGAPCATDDHCRGGFCEMTGVCVEGDRDGMPCGRDTDCPGDRLTPAVVCNITGCDDVQVVSVGKGGLDPRSVVVGPGMDGVLSSFAHGADAAGSNGGAPCATDNDCRCGVCQVPARVCETDGTTPCATNSDCGVCVKAPTLCMNDRDPIDPAETCFEDDASPCDDLDDFCDHPVTECHDLTTGVPPPDPQDLSIPEFFDVDDLECDSDGDCGSCVLPVGAPGVCQRPEDCGLVGVADTEAAPHDRQLVQPNEAVKPGEAIVKPGPDGFLDTIAQPDDVSFIGDRFKITSPLNPDSDFDQIDDGVERLLGSDPTDPRDAGNFADRDQDGLTDDEESIRGWFVTVDDMEPVQVFSNQNLPDTDLDGLPDFMERLLRTDPRSEDTDGDGLSDFDEVGEELFAEFEVFEGFFRGFRLNPDDSERIGTDPTRTDTDGDGLADGDEIRTGVLVQIPGSGDIRRVFTDPTNADTDADGLADGAEARGVDGELPFLADGEPNPGDTGDATDPTDSDTDDDGRTDGQEVNRPTPTDPHVPDVGVTVRFTQLDFHSDRSVADGRTNHIPEWFWLMYVQLSDEPFPGGAGRCGDGVCVLGGVCRGGPRDGMACTAAPLGREHLGNPVASPYQGCPPQLPDRRGTDNLAECHWCTLPGLQRCVIGGDPCTSDSECPDITASCDGTCQGGPANGRPCDHGGHCNGTCRGDGGFGQPYDANAPDGSACDGLEEGKSCDRNANCANFSDCHFFADTLQQVHLTNLDVTLNAERRFALRAGEGFVVHGVVGDLDDTRNDDDVCVRGCTMTFRNAFRFNELQTGFSVQEIELQGNGSSADGDIGTAERCAATLFVELQVD